MTKKDDQNLMTDVASRLDDMFGDEDLADGEFADTSLSDSSLGDDSFDDALLDEPILEEPENVEKVKVVEKEKILDLVEPEEVSAAKATELDDLKSIILSMDWEINDQIMNNLITEVTNLKGKHSSDKVILTFLTIHESVAKYIRRKKADAHQDSIKLVHSAYAGLEKVITSPDMSETDRKKLLLVEVNNLKALKQHILRSQMNIKHPHEALAIALEEIKKTIRAEFKTLKEELKALF